MIHNRIIIGPYVYRVSRKAKHFLDTDDALGNTDYDRCRIAIRPGIPWQVASETLLHEVLHVLTSVSGLSAEWGRDKDEEVVRRLTPGLLEVLRNNPDLVAYLLGRETVWPSADTDK